MHIMKNIISITLLSLVFSLSLNAGGPWTLKKGGAYIKVSEWWTVFGTHFTDTGQIDDNLTNGIFSTSLFLEYGFSDRLTATLDGPIFSRNVMNNLVSRTTGEILVPGEALNSVGDINLGIKYGLSKPGAAIPVALSLTLGLPTGEPGAGTQGNLQTGDGEFNQMLRLDAGKGFNLGKKSSGYFSAYVGFNNRTNEFSEEFRYGAELGIGLANERLWFQVKLDASESFKNGATAATATSTSIFANNSEFVTYTLETNIYFTEKFGFSAAITPTIRGEIIAAEPSYNLGLFFDLD